MLNKVIAKKLLAPIFTGFQWVTWMWSSILGEATDGSWERPTAVTAAILFNEAISTQLYGRLLRKLDAENTNTPLENTLSKATLSNMSAGVTFYFVDSAIANSDIQYQLLWRCAGVFFVDGIVHFSTSKIVDQLGRTASSSSIKDLNNAYEAGIAAIAYVLSEQLATYVTDSNNIDNQLSRYALSSLFIFLATTSALPISRCVWRVSRYCGGFFKINTNKCQEEVEAEELPQLPECSTDSEYIDSNEPNAYL